MNLKVLIADDHPIVSTGIEAILSGHDTEIVATTCSIDETLIAIADHRPDVVVMEARNGGADNLRLLESLPESFSPNRVIVFSAYQHSSHIARASALGCYDFLPKSSSPEDLLTAIKAAAAGQSTPPSSLLTTTKTKMRGVSSTDEPAHPLTNREMQVLRHVSMGLSNREIGKALGISIETVKEHVQNVLRKLNVNDRTQAAVWAVRGGFI